MRSDQVERGARGVPRGVRRAAGIATAVALATFAMVAFAPGLGAFAQDISQCDAVGDGGGSGLECHIEVVNNLDLTDPTAPLTSSTVTVTSCLGAADAALAGVCTSVGAVGYSDVVTHVDQCNYAVNGGGSTLLCTVDVLNYVTGGPAPVDPTVNECNNSVTTGDVVECDTYLPSLSTDPATATVVQCNDSDNGGGSVLHCSLAEGSTTSESLTVTVNQCNNSANGGGSSVICRTVIRNFHRPDNTVAFTPPAEISVLPIGPVFTEFVPVPVPAVVPPVVPPVVTAVEVVPVSSAHTTLPNTGSSTNWPALTTLALGLILLGAGSIVASRRWGSVTTQAE